MKSATVLTAYRCGAFIARQAPNHEVTDRLIARAVALASHRISRERQMLVRRNLERVLNRRLTRAEAFRRVVKVFEWYARYYIESFRLPELDARTVDAGFVCDDGFTEIERAAHSGIGPILVLPHLGTWEWAAWWLALVPKMKVTAVVEPLNPPELFEWFADFRHRLGINVIPISPSAGSQLAAAIHRGHVVCLLSDRDISGRGMPTTFFGERTRLPIGPALLSIRTGAPLIPVAVYWSGGTRRAVILPRIEAQRRGSIRTDLARVVQDYAEALEQLIRAAPEQWHLMSPNWPSDYNALNLPIPPSLQDI